MTNTTFRAAAIVATALLFGGAYAADHTAPPTPVHVHPVADTGCSLFTGVNPCEPDSNN